MEIEANGVHANIGGPTQFFTNGFNVKCLWLPHFQLVTGG
jgi:hypothetical protein